MKLAKAFIMLLLLLLIALAKGTGRVSKVVDDELQWEL